MKVTLVSWTPEPERIIAAAAILCYQRATPDEAWEQAANKKRQETLVARLIQAGHWSAVEHVNFTFGIEGISRVCSHQLVRHRIASYSQQSQRYADVGDADYFVKPPSLVELEAGESWGDHPRFEELIGQAVAYYRHVTERTKQTARRREEIYEDARFILPHAGKTNLFWTTNLRNLAQISSLRLCVLSQWEIRQVMLLCKKALMEKDFPLLAKLLVIKCIRWGYCDEGDRCCGIRPTHEAVMAVAKKYRDEVLRADRERGIKYWLRPEDEDIFDLPPRPPDTAEVEGER